MCLAPSSSVSLDSDKPLVFAVAAYRAVFVKDPTTGNIVKDATGQDDIDLQPAYTVSPGGQAENSDAKEKCPPGQKPNECVLSVKVAEAVPSNWIEKHWGEPIK